MKLCSEDGVYGGHGLVEHMTYPVKEFDGKYYVELYLPARTAMILEEKPVVVEKKKRTRKSTAKKTTTKRTKKVKVEE